MRATQLKTASTAGCEKRTSARREAAARKRTAGRGDRLRAIWREASEIAGWRSRLTRENPPEHNSREKERSGGKRRRDYASAKGTFDECSGGEVTRARSNEREEDGGGQKKQMIRNSVEQTAQGVA